MKHSIFFKSNFILLGVLIVFFFNTKLAVAQKTKALSTSSGTAFIENRGQLLNSDGNTQPDILYYGQASGTEVYFAKDKVSHVWSKVDTTPQPDSLYRMDMELLGANTSVAMSADENTQGYMNYFLEHIPNGVVGVPVWDKITYSDLWPNIDMIVRKKSQGLEYELTLHPGADPDDIKFKFAGADKVDIDKHGRLKAENPKGKMRFEHPIGQKEDKKKITPVQVNFVKDLNGLITLTIANFKAGIKFSLKIQTGGNPAPINNNVYNQYWAIYFGGNGADTPDDIALDADGNIYVAGHSGSTTFPTTSGVVQPFNFWDYDAVVVKFNSQRARVWATYYGGDEFDEAISVAVDASQNVYIVGVTESSFFPVCNTCGSYTQGFNGSAGTGLDGFVVKLDPLAQNVLFAFWFGGSGVEFTNSIAIDGSHFYIVGETSASTAFPIVPAGSVDSYDQGTYGGGNQDAYIAKFIDDGTLIWSTFFGGAGSDHAYSCTVDNSGNLFVKGTSTSAGFSTCLPTAGEFPLCDPGSGAYVLGNSGSSDIFIAKFESPKGELRWSTMYGGSQLEDNNNFDDNNIAIDGQGNVLVVGSTASSSNFPLLPLTDAYNQPGGYGGGASDGYILKFTNNGVRLWATYLGGSGEDHIDAVTTYGTNVYVTGETFSSDFPTKVDGGAYNQQNLSGTSDAFIGWFSPDGSREWVTYYGGTGTDEGRGIVVDPLSLSLITSGMTGSSDLPTADLPGTNDYTDFTFNGGVKDFFIADFKLSCPCFRVDNSSGNPETKATSLHLYPNPNHGLLTLELAEPEDRPMRVEIYNTLGAKAYSKLLNASSQKSWQIDLSGMSSGTYWLKLKVGQETISRQIITL